jgi:hypothetical protein
VSRSPRRTLFLLAALASVRCSAAPPGGAGAPTSLPPGPAILFIGNSLTESNDLPRRVQELAGDSGNPVAVDAVVAGGFSLGDHLAQGPALARIRSRSWTAVVLQQGPSTLPASRAALIRDAQRLAAEIRGVGARVALLGVWPLPGQRQEDVTASYRAAADAVGAVLIPAGDAWQAARAQDQDLVMTVDDGFHPTPLGTYLAALTVHCVLNGRLPPPPALAVERLRAGADLSAEQAAVLRSAACPAAR